MEKVMQDVRFGLRMLARHRGFTAAALLMLALGIGSNVVVFSLVETIHTRRALVAASYVPARRAMTVDPIQAFRVE